MARRRKTSARAETENEILSQGRWIGLKDQWFSEAINHTESANQLARERCRGLVEGTLDLSQYLSFTELWGSK